MLRTALCLSCLYVTFTGPYVSAQNEIPSKFLIDQNIQCKIVESLELQSVIGEFGNINCRSVVRYLLVASSLTIYFRYGSKCKIGLELTRRAIRAY